MVTRLEIGKGIDIVIDAFKALPKKNLIIKGTGSLETKFKEQAKDCPNIRFVNFNDYGKLVKLYAGCICLIHATFPEDWSMAISEAQACGKPCIGINAGTSFYPPDNLIEGATGMLIANKDDLIMAIELMEKEHYTTKWKASCLAKAQESDITFFFENWDNVIGNSE